MYPDELLLGRIDQSQVRFVGSSRPVDQRHWMQFKTDVTNCLRTTVDWRDTLAEWMDDTAKMAPDESVICEVYNPADLMASLVFGWPDCLGPFLPSIQAAAGAPPSAGAPHSGGRLARGTLVWTGARTGSISESVYAVYPEPFEWAMARQLGAAWEADLELLARLNLRYALFEWSSTFTTGTLLELHDGRLERKPPEGREHGTAIWDSARPLRQFLADHAEEITNVADNFRASYQIF